MNETKAKSKPKIKEKESLLSIVSKLKESKPVIVGVLSSNNLYNKYLNEVENENLGIPSRLEYTMEDLSKMIEDYLKKGGK
jgi:phosphotransferase system IIB component